MARVHRAEMKRRSSHELSGLSTAQSTARCAGRFASNSISYCASLFDFNDLHERASRSGTSVVPIRSFEARAGLSKRKPKRCPS
jgi:hypothetical protein